MDVTLDEVFPAIPSYNDMFMLEAMTYRVTLSTPTQQAAIGPELIVQAWTNQYDSNNCDGKWHSIDLDYLGSNDDNRRHNYGKSVIITSDCDFRFTFRYRWRGSKTEEDWRWTHPYMVDGEVHVEAPRLYDAWTQGPDYNHIADCVFLGNFIAATNARQCGFTHVLNVADNLDMVFAEGDGVTYQKVPMRDGAHNPIEPEKVEQAVAWLMENNQNSNRILVNCRAGIGRAGSVGVAFVFARNPSMSYEEAKELVLSKRFVYPHAGLEEMLYRLFERN